MYKHVNDISKLIFDKSKIYFNVMVTSVILKELIAALDMSVNAFERAINVGASAIAKAIQRDTVIKQDTIDKIVKTFPSVNPDWLQTGKGEMFLSPPVKPRKEVIALGRAVPSRLTAEQYAEAYGDWLGVPMYNAPVTASFVESYTDKQVYKPQYYLHDPRFKDCAFGVVITGDSMHGEIRHGDYVACQEITDWRFIVYGDIYYIVTAELQTCKYINADPNNPDNWLLVPHNKSISPSPIPKEMVKRLFKVRGVVRGY